MLNNITTTLTTHQTNVKPNTQESQERRDEDLNPCKLTQRHPLCVTNYSSKNVINHNGYL